MDAKGWAGQNGREKWYRQTIRYAAILGAAVWLCIYPVALIFAGVVFFLWVPQGTELLLIIMTETIAWSALILFHVSLLALGFSGWYYSRVLLARRFHGYFANPLLQSEDPSRGACANGCHVFSGRSCSSPRPIARSLPAR